MIILVELDIGSCCFLISDCLGVLAKNLPKGEFVSVYLLACIFGKTRCVNVMTDVITLWIIRYLMQKKYGIQ